MFCPSHPPQGWIVHGAELSCIPTMPSTRGRRHNFLASRHLSSLNGAAPVTGRSSSSMASGSSICARILNVGEMLAAEQSHSQCHQRLLIRIEGRLRRRCPSLRRLPRVATRQTILKLTPHAFKGIRRSEDRDHDDTRVWPARQTGSSWALARSNGGNIAVALQYAAAGITVFPCFEAGVRAKEPRTQHGHHDATTDIVQIRRWWQFWPAALVGMPTGPSPGVWVLDIDGSTGLASLRGLLSKLGLETVADLTRVAARTPSGGLHLYFALRDGERPRNRAGDIGAGLDTRGVKEDGTSAGYVIAPGTVLPDGRSYDWVDTATLLGSGGWE